MNLTSSLMMRGERHRVGLGPERGRGRGRGRRRHRLRLAHGSCREYGKRAVRVRVAVPLLRSRSARAAERGVDVIIAQGGESGGPSAIQNYTQFAPGGGACWPSSLDGFFRSRGVFGVGHRNIPDMAALLRIHAGGYGFSRRV
jgi:hypothetical protein